MKKVFILLSLILFQSCLTVTFLPSDDTPYESTYSIKVYWEEPEEQYFIIGKISVTSTFGYTEKEMFEEIKKEARKIGAHAIIMSGTSTDSSVAGFPGSSGGTYIFSETETRMEALAIRFE